MVEQLFRHIGMRVLGFKSYLQTASNAYLWLVNKGFFKQAYPELFYLNKIINEGDVCVDIGANVGYYSSFMSKACGPRGKVIAIEPVALFADIFKKNTARYGYDNIRLHQVALGPKAGKLVMGTPQIDGVLRHGLTHIVQADEDTSHMKLYDVDVVTPDTLLSGETRIDFVKCDVEGYEIHLFPLFIDTLTRHKPILQIEISGEENIRQMLQLLTPIGYRANGLKNGKLQPLHDDDIFGFTRDFYFLPQAATNHLR